MKQGVSGARPVARGEKNGDSHAAAIAFDCRLDSLAGCAKCVDNSPSGRYESATAVYSQVDGIIIFRHCCERVGYVLVRATGTTVAHAFVVGDIAVYSDDHVKFLLRKINKAGIMLYHLCQPFAFQVLTLRLYRLAHAPYQTPYAALAPAIALSGIVNTILHLQALRA